MLLLGLFGSGCQNDSDAPADVPSDSARSAAESLEGMVLVPGGRTKIGIEQERWDRIRSPHETGPPPLFGRDATPPFRANVDSFFLDRHPVTVEQFRAFVDATGYTTQAEEFGDGAFFRTDNGASSTGHRGTIRGAPTGRRRPTITP